MSYVERLRQAVLKELQTERIGTPVFSRLVMEISPDHGHLLNITAGGVQLTEELLGAKVGALLALGDVKSGHVSAQLRLDAGKSALVTAALVRNEIPRLDLLVVGSRGTVRHSPSADALAGELSEEAGDWPNTELAEAAKASRQALEEALRSHKLTHLRKDR